MTKNKNNEVIIRSSAAEYLNYVASVGEETHNVEVRYEDEKITIPIIIICKWLLLLDLKWTLKL